MAADGSAMFGPAYQGRTIARPPSRAGGFGRAWHVSMLPLGHRGRPDWDATLVMWVLTAPQSHPLWWWYALSVIHLRPIEGVKPAHISVPGSTHELFLVALNPERPMPDLDALDRGEFQSLHLLHPPNVIEQFQVSNDAEALRVGELAVEAIVNGLLSPDTDFRSAWRTAIPETARHLREGVHPVRLQ